MLTNGMVFPSGVAAAWCVDCNRLLSSFTLNASSGLREVREVGEVEVLEVLEVLKVLKEGAEL